MPKLLLEVFRFPSPISWLAWTRPLFIGKYRSTKTLPLEVLSRHPAEGKSTLQVQVFLPHSPEAMPRPCNALISSVDWSIVSKGPGAELPSKMFQSRLFHWESLKLRSSRERTFYFASREPPVCKSCPHHLVEVLPKPSNRPWLQHLSLHAASTKQTRAPISVPAIWVSKPTPAARRALRTSAPARWNGVRPRFGRVPVHTPLYSERASSGWTASRIEQNSRAP